MATFRRCPSQAKVTQDHFEAHNSIQAVCGGLDLLCLLTCSLNSCICSCVCQTICQSVKCKVRLIIELFLTAISAPATILQEHMLHHSESVFHLGQNEVYCESTLRCT